MLPDCWSILRKQRAFRIPSSRRGHEACQQSVRFAHPLIRPENQLAHEVPDIDSLVKITQRLMTDDVVWRADGVRCKEYFNSQHSVAQAFDAYAALFAESVQAK